MLVFPVKAISPTAPVVRSKKSGKSAPSEEVPAARVAAPRPKPSRREGKAFFQSASERSSGGVQAALIDLPRGD